jgi:hypothetical protein
MAVRYTTSLDDLTVDDLGGGFFVGWPTPPTPAVHLALLRGSEVAVLAIDDEAPPGSPGRVVGFITAIGDGRVLEALGPRYMVDLVCDDDLVPFYERLGLSRYTAMIRRDRGAIMTAVDRFADDAPPNDPRGGPTG